MESLSYEAFRPSLSAGWVTVRAELVEARAAVRAEPVQARAAVRAEPVEVRAAVRAEPFQARAAVRAERACPEHVEGSKHERLHLDQAQPPLSFRRTPESRSCSPPAQTPRRGTSPRATPGIPWARHTSSRRGSALTKVSLTFFTKTGHIPLRHSGERRNPGLVRHPRRPRGGGQAPALHQEFPGRGTHPRAAALPLQKSASLSLQRRGATPSIIPANAGIQVFVAARAHPEGGRQAPHYGFARSIVGCPCIAKSVLLNPSFVC